MEEQRSNTYRIAMSTKKGVIDDKKMNYFYYGIANLYSKYSDENIWNYLYESSLDEHKMELENLSNRKIETIKRNIRKLEKLDNKVLQRKVYNNEIVYLIFNKSIDGKFYVLIEDDILRVLVNTTNNNVIKTYCILKYLLANGKRIISRDKLLELIGLTTFERNLQLMTDIIDTLVDMYLIKKSYNIEKKLENDEIKISQKLELELTTYEEWMNRPSQMIKIKKKKKD